MEDSSRARDIHAITMSVKIQLMRKKLFGVIQNLILTSSVVKSSLAKHVKCEVSNCIQTVLRQASVESMN